MRWWTKAWFNNREEGEASVEIEREQAIRFIHDNIEKDVWLEEFYLLWMLAVISGVAVANLYYNQPLLNRMGEDLHVSEFTANLIPMVTQIGYALGLLFIIPLGDLYKRRNIIVINFSLLACSMLAVAVAPDIRCILAASLVTGVCSVMPQIFIPMVSQFSLPPCECP